jgi:peptidoglycan hydrolase-like protein with peptidoglycan-binding domain
MKKAAVFMTLGTALLLGACGSSVENRAGSGGLSGAAAGAVVGGPVGAVVGGAGGAYAGATMDEGLEKKVPEVTERVTGSGSSGEAGSRHASASGHHGMSRQEVRGVQRSLRDGGYTVAVDGIWGPRTEGALRDFQQAKGLQATGRVNQETMAALHGAQTGSPAGTAGATGSGATSQTSTGTSQPNAPQATGSGSNSAGGTSTGGRQ